MMRVNWTPELTAFFVNALVQECRAGNRPNRTLNRIGKKNVVQRLRDHTGRTWRWETCRHKWDELKKKWTCWRHLIKFSGVGRHPKTGVIDMPKDWWDQRIDENPLARQFQTSCLRHEEELNFIFAKMEPVNMGPNEDGGHEGGQAGPPTHYLDSDTSDSSDNDIQALMPGPSTSQPMHTSSRSASGKRQSNDFWEGFKNFYQEISSSKKQKETCSASEKHDPDPEYEALMKELLEGGVDPKSKEYFMASEVLLDIHRRAFGKQFLSPTDPGNEWYNRHGVI
ncbi:hypothetical protein U9M48_037344 [Paspalum notatum var. saurae]|uniref:Myb/SANT-like domain-containing protein n=1 Tax=Paspalum notatum var. saurae TaxID=547442 RepID=A0AAQ3XAI9_PASNO